MNKIIPILCFIAVMHLCINGEEMHGILINGVTGTQLYDPINAPHSTGGLELRATWNIVEGAPIGAQ
jgi:hypothetical protein